MTKPLLRIRALRKQRKLTQARLAEAAGGTLTQGNISEMETGKMNPTLETLGNLAAALDVEPHELFASFEKHAGAVVLFHTMEELSDEHRDAVIAMAQSLRPLRKSA